MDRRSIVVFDSGYGGISVLKRLVQKMPNEDYVYYGDSANAPYGIRTPEEIQKLTLAGISRACESCLPKAIVIACNTATAAAADYIRQYFPGIPVVGILPAVDSACAAIKSAGVLVLATQSTVSSDAFHQLWKQADPDGNAVALGTPGIVEYVESGFADRNKLVSTLIQQLKPYAKERFEGVVLGCTHFPFAAGEIQEAIGHKVLFFDGGYKTAQETQKALEELGWRNHQERRGSIQMLNSCEKQESLRNMWKLFAAELLC